MPALTEYERLNRALSIYRDAMRSHIKDVLEDTPPEDDPTNDWYERKVIANIESEHQQAEARRTRSRTATGSDEWQGLNQLDIPHFLFAIKHNGGFRKLDSQEMFDRMAKIYDARNRWAHPPHIGFTRSEVERTIHQIFEVLISFDQAAANEAMAMSMRELEVDAGMEALEAIKQIEESVRELREKPEIDANAISDVIRSATNAPRLVREISERIDRLETDMRKEQEARERQLSSISETLSILVQAEQARQEETGSEDWIEALFGKDAKQYLQRLRDSLKI